MNRVILISLIFYICSESSGLAQNKFYVGLSGGVNQSYSQNRNHVNFYSITKKGGHQSGFKLGYTFASGRDQIETGVMFGRYNMLFHSSIDFDFYPDFYLSYNAYQIPLHYKLTIVEPHQKLRVYSVIGIAFIETLTSYEKTKIGFEKNPSFKPDTTFDYTHAELPAQLKVQIGPDSFFSGGKSLGFLCKAGLGLAYKITERFEVDAVGMFQMGTNVLFAADANYIHTTQVRPYIWRRTVSATSKADALTFNVGLNYHFGKRKPMG